ncbi:MAG: sulfotransferase domain-containing protein [Chlamydiales bacterium]
MFAGDFILVTFPGSGTHMMITLLNQPELGGYTAHWGYRPRLPKKEFYLEHIRPFFNNRSSLLLNKRIIFHVRDVRDITISRLDKAIRRYPDSFPFSRKALGNRWMNLSYNEKLSSFFQPEKWGHSAVLLDTLCLQQYLPLLDRKNVLITRFEKLVGPKGGGNQEDQLHEIRRIAQFLHRDLTDEELLKLAVGCFGGWGCHRGETGRWKEHFHSEHIQLAKPYFTPFLEFFGYDTSW